MSTLTNKEIQEFWYRAYLGTTTNLLEACIDRAYRDFNRTLHGIGKIQSKEKYDSIKQTIRNIAEEIVKLNINNQLEFDNWHKQKCNLLKEDFVKHLDFPLTYGQAQKWINMTLKYLYALGENYIKGISRNYEYFHIPIDNIIQEKFSSFIPKLDIAWSRLDNYEKYITYQKHVRQYFKHQIPMDIEFKSFNE